MTPEEAIKTIQVAIAEVEWDYPLEYAIAFETAIESLRNQIPKKPNLWCGKITTCPNCLRAISQTEALDVHCKYCGQFIDWGDTE